MAEKMMKLYVCGETSPDPEKWSIWSEYALVLAASPEEAAKLSERTPVTEIPLDKPLYLVGMTEPTNWGDDL